MYELSFISLLALCMVSFIGVPHGSFDGAVAALLGYKTRKDFFIFVILYLIISASVIVFWIYFPVVALFIFIFMSVIHFGLCDWSYLELGKYKWSVSITHGLNIVFGIIFFHTSETFEIFAFLSNSSFIHLQNYLFIAYFFYFILLLRYSYLAFIVPRLRWGLLEMIIVLLIVFLTEPLVAFSIYFCFIHTFKHVKSILKDTSKYLSNNKFVTITTISFTLLTWIGGSLAIVYLYNNYSFEESFIKTLFIGLAALTLPHMTLVDVFYRRKFN